MRLAGRLGWRDSAILIYCATEPPRVEQDFWQAINPARSEPSPLRCLSGLRPNSKPQALKRRTLRGWAARLKSCPSLRPDDARLQPQSNLAGGWSTPSGLQQIAIIRSVLVFLRTVGWLACVVYATIPSFWLMIHPRVHYWRSRQGSPYRLLIPFWIAMWSVVAAGTAKWRDLPRTHAMELAACRLALRRRSVDLPALRCRLQRRPARWPSELIPGHRGQRLITSGIRSRVRHPVYLAHLARCWLGAWGPGWRFATR
jgi:hypothetical protein